MVACSWSGTKTLSASYGRGVDEPRAGPTEKRLADAEYSVVLDEGLVLPRFVSQNHIRPVLIRMHPTPGDHDRIGTPVGDLFARHRAALDVFLSEHCSASGGPNDIRRLPSQCGHLSHPDTFPIRAEPEAKRSLP